VRKYFITSLIFLLGFFLSSQRPVQAQMGSMMGLDNDEIQVSGDEDHAESVEVVLQNFLNRQKVSTVQDLDLSKISDDEWERLGDAVMEQMHPGQVHEAMDQMMGGEGSESLKQMHINMGKAYLGYGSNRNNNSSLRGGGFPMMGFGSMMGYGGNVGAYGILGSLTWLALMIFLVAGAYFFIKQANKK